MALSQSPTLSTVSTPDLPYYLDSKDIARIAGVRAELVRDLLDRWGVADRSLGRAVRVSRHDLRAHNPKLYRAVIDRLFPQQADVEDEDDDEMLERSA